MELVGLHLLGLFLREVLLALELEELDTDMPYLIYKI